MPTIIACIKANVLAKRVTYSTLICRVLMALLTTIIIWIFANPIFNWLTIFPQEDVGIVLAVFTIIYNLIYIIIMLPLTKPIEKFANKVFVDRDEEKKKQSLRYINDNLLNTPSVAIIQVKKEIENMLELSRVNLFLGLDCIYTQDLSKAKEIEDREEKIDYLNSVISAYLIKLSSTASLYDEAKIGGYYHVINRGSGGEPQQLAGR